MSQSLENTQDIASSELVRSANQLSHMMRQGRSFSGHERNCCFLNTRGANGGDRFANVSAASGLDFSDDGRAVALVDWDQDGDLDLWSSNRNAPRLRLMRNDTPTDNHFLALRLKGNGTTTNRDAIGARVEVVFEKTKRDGRKPQSVKTLRAGEGFLSQSSKWLHFGLGSNDMVQKVIVHWPGSDTEEFANIQPDRRYLLIEGTGESQDVTLPKRSTALATEVQEPADRSEIARIPLVELLRVPRVRYMTVAGQPRDLRAATGHSLLVNLWASWCAPCMEELTELARRHEEIQAQGIEIVAICVDKLEDDSSESSDAVQQKFQGQFPFTTGWATPEVVKVFELLHQRQFALRRALPLPSSFLIDPQGRLSVIYKGPLSIDDLLADISHAKANRQERFKRSALVRGSSISHPRVEETALNWAANVRFLLASDLRQAGSVENAALQYTEVLKIKPDMPEAENDLGFTREAQGHLQEAIGHYRRALKINPRYAEAHNNLGNALQKQNQLSEAVDHYQRAIDLKPVYAEAHNNLGVARQRQRKFAEAIDDHRHAIRLNPNYAQAHCNLAIAYHSIGKLREATEHYQHAVRLKPDFTIAYRKLGEIAVREGRSTEAVANFSRAIEIDPKDADAHNNLAVVLQKQGHFAEAENHYSHAVRLRPSDPEMHNNLGVVLARRGNLVEAARHFEHALRLDPLHREASNNLRQVQAAVQGNSSTKSP